MVAAGFMDPGFGVSSLTTRLRRLVVDPEMIIEVPFFTTPSFELARERIVSKVEDAFPSDDPWNTVEVDVIGISMGGLVARFAAIPMAPVTIGSDVSEESAGGGASVKRLRIRTLYTLGTPHHGASRAMSTLAFDGRIEDMRAGSGFLESLNECWCERDYELVAYTRLGDDIVGCANALDPDGCGWWLDPPMLSFSHLQMQSDPRIVCDILRRIRGQEAWTMGEPSPLPE
ncbi:MAG: alpha/beta hydrolase [Phycisphaerales bacterium]